MALKKSSELRQQEHVNSRQFHIKFDGTAETCPYKVGELYDGRMIISMGFNTTLYGHSYHLIVERDRTCLLYTSPSPRDRQKSRMPSSA